MEWPNIEGKNYGMIVLLIQISVDIQISQQLKEW